MASLLAWTDSRVVVSSTVDNPRDFPEHLIDHDPSTAWNGKTGNLTGGFIGFRVPKETRVDRIRITCGFDKISGDGKDLFTANHRIKKVRITRDLELLKEVTLDTERRELQSIPIHGRGGDYKIEVLETVPGTNSAWKELVVGELEVLGDPAIARLPQPHMPRVRVGSFDAPEWTKPAPASKLDAGAAPRSSIGAYCKWFTDGNEAAVHTQYSSPDFPCQENMAHATCNDTHEAPLMPPGDLKELVWLETEGPVTTTRDLALVQKDGAFTILGGVQHDRCQLGDATMQEVKLISARHVATDGGVSEARIVLEYVARSPMYADAETGEPAIWLQGMAHREEIVCRATAGNPPACEPAKKLKSFLGRVDTGVIPPYETWR